MNYERMWHQLKARLVKKSDDVDGLRKADYNDALLTMSSIEAEEYEKPDLKYTLNRDVTGKMEAYFNDAKEFARRMREERAREKIIDNIPDLEKAVFSKDERKVKEILVDLCIVADIPERIIETIMERGIRLKVYIPDMFKDLGII